MVKKTKKAEVKPKPQQFQLADAGVAILFTGICLLAGALGSIFTMPQIATWYSLLNKPFFSPPNWVFGPVWTALYILMGIALFLVWKQGVRRLDVSNAMAWFGAQLALNVLWSMVFFGMQFPWGGAVMILLLWATLAVTIWKFYKISRTAGILMVPYILWGTFATLLNIAVALMNP